MAELLGAVPQTPASDHGDNVAVNDMLPPMYRRFLKISTFF